MFRTLVYSLITLVLTTTNLNAQLPYYCNWAQETGSTGFERNVGIATDSSDNIYNIGVFRSAFDADYGPGITMLTPYNDGNDDLFITKHSRDGSLSWAFKLGNSNKDFAKTIVLDSAANFYLTGGFSSYLDCDPGPANYWLTAYNYGIFIAKYDSLAHIKWAKSISGGQVEMGRDLALDHDCNIYVTGSFGTPSNNTSGYMVDFNPDTGVSTLTCNGATDIFVCKFDSSGHFLWADQIGGTGIDFGYNIVTDDSGNCYVLGDFSGTVDFDPDPAVVYNLTSSGNSQFVLKLDRNGHFQWAFKITTGSSLDPDGYGHRILVNGAGEIYLPLGINGTADLNPLGNPYVVNVSQAEYLLKYSTNGQLIDPYLLCQSLPSFAVTSIKQLGSDKLLFTGTAVGAADLDPGSGSMIIPWLGYEDCYFSVFDTSGSFITGKWAGSTTHDGYLDIASGHHGNIFACGYHGDINGGGGSMDFGDSLSVFNYNYAGWYDCTLVKYSLQPSTFIHPSICAGDTFATPLNNYSAQGFYTETYLNSSSDSTIIIDLQVNHADTLVTQSSQSLFANATNATFQWYDCLNQSLLPGETNANLMPFTSGSYAVIVTQYGCMDTSSCYSFTMTSSNNDQAESNKIWYDSQDQVLRLSTITDSRIEIYDCFGKSVGVKPTNISTNEIDCSAFSNGIYFARIIMNNGEGHTYKFYK